MVEREHVDRSREKAQALEDALNLVQETSRALGSEAGPPRLNLSTASGFELVEKTLKVGQIRKSIHGKTVPRLAAHLQEVRHSPSSVHYLEELQLLSDEGYITPKEKRLAQKQLKKLVVRERLPSLRRRKSNPEFFQLLHGSVETPPRYKDLKDSHQFLSIKKAVGAGIASYKGGLSALLPAVLAETDITIVRYRAGGSPTYYVPTHQANLLREKWHEYLAKHKPALRPPSSTKLVPEQAEKLADKIKAQFGEEEPIFYSQDPCLRKLLGVSRYLLSEILQLAQRQDVIPTPHIGSNKEHGEGRFYYYSRLEILKALDYFFQLRQEGQAFYPTMRTLREKEIAGQKLTLREAAERLGIKPALLQRAIVKGGIDWGSSQVVESVRRINYPSISRTRLIDPTIFTPEFVEKFNKAKKMLFPKTVYYFQRDRVSFSTVSEVFEMAYGAHPNPRHVAEVAQSLIENGVEVSYLTSKGPRRGGYWVLAREDQERAVRILQDNPAQ